MTLTLLLFTLSQDPVVVDQVLATVNNQVLTLAQVNKEVKGLSHLLPLDQRDYAQLRRQALKNTLRVMLFSEGFYALARQKGLVGVLDNKIIAAREKEEEIAGSVAAFAETLEAAELTIQAWEDLTKRDLAATYFRRMVMGLDPIIGTRAFRDDCRAKPSEVLAWYENNLEKFQVEPTVKARIIQLKEDPDKDPALDRIEAMAAAFRRGQLDFAKTAKEQSAYRASTYGSLGRMNPEKAPFAAPIKDFLMTAKVGELSAPIPLPNHWALILVEEIQPAGIEPFHEVQAFVEDVLLQEARIAAVKEELIRLKNECTIWATPEAMGILDGLVAELGPTSQEEL